MKNYTYLLLSILVYGMMGGLWAQDKSGLDLSTRCVGAPPQHVTVSSVAQWMENPIDQQLQICVSNFYAAASDYMEIDVAGNKLKFQGAGLDGYGNYIPTNYPPVTVGVVLRRAYNLSIMCPNSGPQGSPLFNPSDFASPGDFISALTNSYYNTAVDAFLWTNFSKADRSLFASDNPTLDGQCQTNLVTEMNRIITTFALYTNSLFASYTNSNPIPGILAQNPTVQQVVYINRLLLQDAINLQANSQYDDSGSAQITFSNLPPQELRIKKYRTPPTYTVSLNGDSSGGGMLQLQNLGTGYYSFSNSVIEVLQGKFGNCLLGDGCDDATKVPGQGSWLKLGPGCTGDTNRISLEWHVSLGRTFDGLAAGQLSFEEPGLTSDSYTPNAIYYNGSMAGLWATETMYSTNLPYLVTNSDLSVTTNRFIPVASQEVWSVTNNGVVNTYTNCLVPVVLLLNNSPFLMTNSAGTVYTNYQSVIRQVNAYQTFVDVLTPNTNTTVLNFYHPSQVGTARDFTGLYTNITGTPFTTWTIQNPQPGAATSLNINGSENGSASTQSLAETPSSGGVTWKLTLGTGAAQRVETRQVAFSGGPNPTNRFELDSVAYASNPGSPDYQCQETYQSYPWGWELVQTSIPNGSSPLVTSYEYYDNQNKPSQYSATGNGQVEQITYPDGYWELRIYQDLGYEIPIIGDPFFVSMCVLTPWPQGGAASPAEANVDNANLAIYNYECYNGIWSRNLTQIDTLHNGAMTIHTFSGNGTQENNTMVNETISGPWFLDLPGDPDSVEAWPNDRCDFDDGDALGIAGHPLSVFQYGAGATSSIYYHGVFNPLANQFIIDPENHLYNGEDSVIYDPDNTGGAGNLYPDHCEMDIFSSLRGWWSANNINGNGAVPSVAEDDPCDLDTVENLMVSYYIPLVTRKATKIYQNGSLVQTESYVYNNPNSGGQAYINDSYWTQLYRLRYYNDSLGRATNVVRIDDASGKSRTIYTANYQSTEGCDGPLLLSETDDTGQQTSYSYDALQRLQTAIRNGYGGQPEIVTNYSYNSDCAVVSRITSATNSAGTLSRSESWTYDLASRQTEVVDPSGIATTITYSANNQTTTKTRPGGVTTISQQYVNRQPESLSGTGIIGQYYSYDAYSDPSGSQVYGPYFSMYNWAVDQLQFTYLGAANSPRWRMQGTTMTGAVTRDVKPVGGGTANVAWTYHSYTQDGHVIEFEGSPGSATSPGFPSTTIGFDEFGGTNYQCQGPDSSLITTCVGTTRDTFADTRSIQIGSVWYQATTNYVWLTDQSGNGTVSSVHLEQLNGFPANVISSTLDLDADGNVTISTNFVNFSSNVVTTVTSEPFTSNLNATNIYQNGRLISSSTLSAGATVYGYDSLGHTNLIQDPQGNFTTMTYDPNTGWLTSVTDPVGNTTSYTYFSTNQANAGKLYCRTDANKSRTYYAYTTQGQLFQTWGDVPQPAEYIYNEYGDLTNLVTFRGGTGWTGSSWPSGSVGTGDNTYWFYDSASGALTNKTDAQGRSVTYTYDPNTGKMLTRSWARTVGGVPVTVTNGYDQFLDLTSQNYCDGTPSVLFNNYNRAGQPREIVDGAGTNEMTYDNASRMTASSYTSGPLSGITVSNHFNPYYGRDVLKVINGTSLTLEDDYGYDSYGRLGSVTNGDCSATYGYVPNMDLLQSTTFKNGSTTVMKTTRSWLHGFQLQSIANIVNGAPVTSHAYQYDVVNRRTRAALEDNSVWQYGYDNRNELTSANRSWSYYSTTTPVSGQQFSYSYDNVGNRTTAQFGGDTSGQNLQTISYMANSLNQYTSVITPGTKDVIGAAFATNSVSVNGGIADRHGEYFHRQISVANTNQPVWQTVSISSGGTSDCGFLTFPANSQTLVYDADGNLSFDGIWSYQWNGENRLNTMWMTNGIANIANSNCLKLDFTYDGTGRRIQKVASTWNGSTFSNPVTNRFVYDGWNLVALLNSQLSIPQSFVWGNDLSGTLQGASGVGGLLIAVASSTNCFAAFDGNGNVTAMVNAADGSLEARYEYNPYGDLSRETGPFSKQNPFRFSSKFWDEESALVCYPSRVYSPRLGKWLGRDPLQEKGGINLLVFVKNNPVNAVDSMGQEGTLADTDAAMSQGEAMDAGAGDAAEGILGEVRQVVDTFNEIQQESTALMDSATGDTTDLYMDLLENADSQISEGLSDLSNVGKSGINEFENHHIFPQQFRADFKRAGINIDQFLVKLGKDVHTGVHQGGWNADWQAFLGDGGSAPSASEMFDFALEMMQKYGCDASALY